MKKLFLALSLVFIITSCNNEVKKPDNDTLFQISTIDALLAGYYDGVMPLNQLIEHGNFGLGTFNKLDGEMIVYDGTVYQFKTDGKLYKADPNNSTPFACVVNFKTSYTSAVNEGTNYADFQKLIDLTLPNDNLFYAIKVTGDFSYIKTRSVPEQEKPYIPLAEVTKNQSVFEKNNQTGTLVGFRIPSFAAGINVAGYHMHFISSDFTFGGHVLDFTAGKVTVEIMEVHNFKMTLPENSDFGKVDLTKDRSQELEKVEK